MPVHSSSSQRHCEVDILMPIVQMWKLRLSMAKLIAQSHIESGIVPGPRFPGQTSPLLHQFKLMSETCFRT